MMNGDAKPSITTKNETYVNGSIEDFTECTDFSKFYQKSCSTGIKEPSLNILINCTKKEVLQEEDEIPKKLEFPDVASSPLKTYNSEFENDGCPMEPQVSITVEESNLEKTINHVAKGSNSGIDVPVSDVDVKEPSAFVKNVPDKSNHLRHMKSLPTNRAMKKKISAFKYRREKRERLKNKELYSPKLASLHGNLRFKCYKCSQADFATIIDLNRHQKKCGGSFGGSKGVSDGLLQGETSAGGPSNVKVTRKVYLCSACGSYFENWNLFLHMKEMHKRHICLYCLGMFSQPDKLGQHLQTKHNISEQVLSSQQAFQTSYKGTCYLICCSCESLFSEKDQFYDHTCSSPLPGGGEESSTCPQCGLYGGTHYPTCRRALADHAVERLHKSHLKRTNGAKKKVKSKKRTKDVFRVVSNESGDLSVTVRKQPEERVESSFSPYFPPQRDFDPARLALEESTRQYNEKLLQLYRPTKPPDKVTSTLQSIEDSINRVVEESLRVNPPENVQEEEEEEEEDTNSQMPMQDEVSPAESFALPPQTFVPIPSLPIDESQDKNCDETEEEQSQEATVMSSTAQTDVARNEEEQIDRSYQDDSRMSDNESTDSEKLTIALEPSERVESPARSDDGIPTAGHEIAFLFVPLEDAENLRTLVKECVKVSCWNCVYCAHAKRIAVNGKQLALHLLAEHRFVLGHEEQPEDEQCDSAIKVVERLKNGLPALETCFFNSDSFDSEDKSFWKASDRVYECFHCLFTTYVHKELYSHNRKMHQKAVFLCIMCKSSFYNYSELLCHLCLGIYIPGQVINPEITYRCYACDADPLPSAFRLMVHLRRKHNSCDICFDVSANQFQLSTHVWKHKLSHMCYRCGIAYRNKPDITKHLFWKHGTESVLCKKCFQKKWPHVYHFCVPPMSFVCDECTISLSSAVALKVHKRLHSGDFPYSCDKCENKFISRKLLARHSLKHEESENKTEPELPPEAEPEPEAEAEPQVEDQLEKTDEVSQEVKREKKSKKKKVLRDVFDLPPVNLSESDDSEEEDASAPAAVPATNPVEPSQTKEPFPLLNGDVEKEELPAPQVIDGVWDDFQNYMVKKDGGSTGVSRPPSPFKNMTASRMRTIMLADHDYYTPGDVLPAPTPLETEKDSTRVGAEHDYCNNNGKAKTKKKKKSSSSDSDSTDSDSSCSCGSNCSCSSGSSSSSSTDSDSGKESDSKAKKKERKKVLKKRKCPEEVQPEPVMEIDVSVADPPNENIIQESDLDTEETETDEDFYDYNPAREASRILAEKRTQLLANLNGCEVPPPPQPEPLPLPPQQEEPPVVKKKAKTKKKRSRPSGPMIKISRKKNVVNGVSSQAPAVPLFTSVSGARDVKRPKRRRVPLKFYGFSSDDESESTPSRKREKIEYNTTIPAPAINPVPPEEPPPLSTPIWNPQSKTSLSWRVEKSEDPPTPKVNPIKIRTAPYLGAEFHIKKPTFQINGNSTAQRNEKLYCFCQCPYDEVSEMIACDAEDCLIEWFHFECVGIMVPPKGSWYCPDCKKKFAAENEFLSPPHEHSAN